MLLAKRTSGRVTHGSARTRRRVEWLAHTARVALLTAMSVGTARSQQAPPPTLVVFFTIDQMRPDYLSRFDKQLSGGLARLYHNGAVFENAYQDHAITETAPGHSATLSGRFPRSTGITTNSMGVEDERARLLSGTVHDAAPFILRGTTLIYLMR